MGLDEDGDPPAVQTEEAEDNGDVGMDIEETTDELIKNFEKKFREYFTPEGSSKIGTYKWYNDGDRNEEDRQRR
jgi:hypothetical protein